MAPHRGDSHGYQCLGRLFPSFSRIQGVVTISIPRTPCCSLVAKVFRNSGEARPAAEIIMSMFILLLLLACFDRLSGLGLVAVVTGQSHYIFSKPSNATAKSPKFQPIRNGQTSTDSSSRLSTSIVSLTKTSYYFRTTDSSW